MFTNQSTFRPSPMVMSVESSNVEVVWAPDQDATWARPTGMRPQGGPRSHWIDYMSHLIWETPWDPLGGAGKHCW